MKICLTKLAKSQFFLNSLQISLLSGIFELRPTSTRLNAQPASVGRFNVCRFVANEPPFAGLLWVSGVSARSSLQTWRSFPSRSLSSAFSNIRFSKPIQMQTGSNLSCPACSTDVAQQQIRHLKVRILPRQPAVSVEPAMCRFRTKEPAFAGLSRAYAVSVQASLQTSARFLRRSLTKTLANFRFSKTQSLETGSNLICRNMRHDVAQQKSDI
jgi:hypothetical protein